MKTLALPLTLTALGLMVLAGVLYWNSTQTALGGAFTGTSAFLQYSTTTLVGPQGTGVVRNTIFAENAACKSRTITTNGTSAIRISFDDIPAAGNIGSTTVGEAIGALQLASTTVTYDAENYGCGKWQGWAWASTTLTVSEF